MKRFRHLILLSFLFIFLSKSDAQVVTLIADTAFVTDVGSGGSGASCIYTGGTSYGNNYNNTLPYRIADDVSIPNGERWQIDTIYIYAYQTGSATTSTMTGGVVRVYNGVPGGGGSVVWGDVTTNRMASTSWTKIYRVSSTTLTDVTRPIMVIKLATGGLSLIGGQTYWFEFGVTGSLASGPWAPPKVQPGRLNPAGQNARLWDYTLSAWTPVVDGTANLGMNLLMRGVKTCLQPPVVKVTAVTNPVCSGKSVKLYANGATQYTWSTGATTPTIDVSPTSNTTYTVTGTLSAGCSSVSSIVVTVNPSPTITVNPPTLDICVNDTVNIIANGGVKYKWSTGDDGSSIKIHPRNNTSYVVTGTSANGCTGTATLNATVKDFEVSLSATKAAICEGETVTISATGGTAYSWTPGNLSGPNVNVKPIVPTNYRVRITGPNGCIKYVEIFIDVHPKPLVFINDVKSTTPPPVCQGTELDLRAGGAYSYIWTPDSIPGRIITVAPKTTTRYTVTGSNIWGCTSTASINVPVFAPTSARIESSKGKDPICKGEEITLTAVGLTKPVWWPGKQTTNSITMVPKDIVYAEVTGFDANGCQVTLVFEARTIYCKGVGGGLVENNGRSLTSDMNVTISPMPVREVAYFNFDQATQETLRLVVTTVDGKTIRSEKISEGVTNYEFRKEGLSGGMYFYQFVKDNGEVSKTGKMVIME